MTTTCRCRMLRVHVGPKKSGSAVAGKRDEHFGLDRTGSGASILRGLHQKYRHAASLDRRALGAIARVTANGYHADTCFRNEASHRRIATVAHSDIVRPGNASSKPAAHRANSDSGRDGCANHRNGRDTVGSGFLTTERQITKIKLPQNLNLRN